MAADPVASGGSYAIIVPSNLTSGHAASASTGTTASVTMIANDLYVVTVTNVIGSGTATLPTITGANGTWTQIDTVLIGTNLVRMTTFRDLSGSPGAGGALTIAFGGVTQTKIDWAVDQYTNVNTGGTHGSGAIVQSTHAVQTGTATGQTLTLTSFASSNNMSVGIIGYDSATSPTKGTGFTALATLSDATNVRTIASEYLIQWITPSFSWASASFNTLMMAMEIAATIPPAVDYWVSKGGSDSNAGTQSAPFLRIQTAANLVAPGGTIHVGPGTYGNDNLDEHYCSGSSSIYGAIGVAANSIVCLTTSGVPGAPITFVSEPKWAAKLTCVEDSFTNWSVMWFMAASYVVIKNFDMTCPLGKDGFAADWFGNNGNNTVVGNYFHNFSDQNASCLQSGVLGGSPTTNAAWTNGGHSVYDANIFHRGGPSTVCLTYHGIYAGDYYNTITNNVVSGFPGEGIVISGGGGCHETISNNTVFDNSQAGIIVANTGGDGNHADMCGNGSVTDFNIITNNITVNNSYTAVGSIGSDGGISLYGAVPTATGYNNVVSHNVAFGNGRWQINTIAPTTYQTAISGSNQWTFKNYQQDKNWGAQLANYNYLNYQLRQGSSAINTGTSQGAPNHDIRGVSRPQCGAYDIGAFEASCFGGEAWPGFQVNPQ